MQVIGIERIKHLNVTIAGSRPDLSSEQLEGST